MERMTVSTHCVTRRTKMNNYMNEPMEHEVTDEDIVKEYLRFMDVKKVSKIWQIKTSEVKKILRNNGIQE